MSNFTHKTYKAANAAAKKNPNNVYTSDAGDGWTHKVYFCTWRNRLVHKSVSPEGIEIV